VELRPVDVADRDHVDLLDLRRVKRERPLDADAERLLAHGEGLARARPLPLDADALEHLNARALALDDAEVDAHGVARLEPGQVAAQLAALELLDDLAHRERGPKARAMLANRLAAPLDLDDLADDVPARHGPP